MLLEESETDFQSLWENEIAETVKDEVGKVGKVFKPNYVKITRKFKVHTDLLQNLRKGIILDKLVCKESSLPQIK